MERAKCKSPLPPSFSKDIAEVNSALHTAVSVWLKKHGKNVRPKLTDEQKAQLQECFHLMDADGGGSIDAGELGNAFDLLGIKMSHKELEVLLQEVDEDGDPDLDYAEFVAVMTETLQQLAEDDSDRNSSKLPFALMATAYRRKRLLEGILEGDKEVQAQIQEMQERQSAAAALEAAQAASKQRADDERGANTPRLLSPRSRLKRLSLATVDAEIMRKLPADERRLLVALAAKDRAHGARTHGGSGGGGSARAAHHRGGHLSSSMPTHMHAQARMSYGGYGFTLPPHAHTLTQAQSASSSGVFPQTTATAAASLAAAHRASLCGLQQADYLAGYTPNPRGSYRTFPTMSPARNMSSSCDASPLQSPSGLASGSALQHSSAHAGSIQQQQNRPSVCTSKPSPHPNALLAPLPSYVISPAHQQVMQEVPLSFDLSFAHAKVVKHLHGPTFRQNASGTSAVSLLASFTPEPSYSPPQLPRPPLSQPHAHGRSSPNVARLHQQQLHTHIDLQQQLHQHSSAQQQQQHLASSAVCQPADAESAAAQHGGLAANMSSIWSTTAVAEASEDDPRSAAEHNLLTASRVRLPPPLPPAAAGDARFFNYMQFCSPRALNPHPSPGANTGTSSFAGPTGSPAAPPAAAAAAATHVAGSPALAANVLVPGSRVREVAAAVAAGLARAKGATAAAATAVAAAGRRAQMHAALAVAPAAGDGASGAALAGLPTHRAIDWASALRQISRPQRAGQLPSMAAVAPMHGSVRSSRSPVMAMASSYAVRG